MSAPDRARLPDRVAAGLAARVLDRLGRLPGLAVLLIDATDRVVWSSPDLTDVLGVPAGSLPGDLDGFAYHVHPDDVGPLLETAEVVRSIPGSIDAQPIRFRQRDGSWRLIEVTCHNLLDDPEIGAVVAVLHDVTAPMAAARVVEGRERRFQALIRNSADVIAVLDGDLRIIEIAESVTGILGYLPEHLLGRRLDDLLSDDAQRSGLGDLIERASAVRPEPVTVQASVPALDGSDRRIEATFSDLRDDPDVGGIVVNARDVTEAWRSAEELAQSEQRFRALVQRTEDLVVVISLDSTIQYASDAIERMLGYLPADVVGRRADALVHPDDRPALDTALEVVGSGTWGRAPVVRMQAADGSWLRVELTAANLHDVPEVAGIVVNIREITERYEAEERLRRSEARFRALVRNASDVIAIVARDGRIRYVSPGVEALTGYRPEDLVATSSLALSHPDDTAESIARFEDLVRHKRSMRVVHRILHRDGSVRWVETSLTDRLDDPDVRGVVLNVRDITESQEAREALERSEHSFRTMAAASPIGIIRVEPSGVITYVNDRFRAIVGLGPDDEPGLAADLVHVDDRAASVEAWLAAVDQKGGFDRRLRFTTPDGTVRWGHVRTTPLIDAEGDLVGYVGTVEDISEHKQREDRLAHQATHDPLTGLPNRTLLVDRLEVALARAERAAARVAVLFCDLDHFKAVNDRLGHAAGDELLVRIAGVLRDQLRPGDTVARFGGDEFVVLCEDVVDLAEAEQIAARVRAAFEQPFVIDGNEVRITSSTGVALSDPGADDGESLLRDADAAMYRAKAYGRARHAVFDASMRDEVAERRDLQQALQLAVPNGQLDLVYQPVISFSTGEILGVEALVRWNRPGIGVLAPPAWLSVAEETGLIIPVGRWVAATAMAAAATWEHRLPTGTAPWLALNLSRRQLEHPGLVDELLEAAELAGLSTHRVVLEVTESAATPVSAGDDGVLAELRDQGMRIALDDVGSGESTLIGLHRFPPDQLKVDRLLVAELGRSGLQRTVVEALVALAGSLDIEVIAEGVETGVEMTRLHAAGCHLGQGFHLCPPVGLDELGDLLERRSQSA